MDQSDDSAALNLFSTTSGDDNSADVVNEYVMEMQHEMV